jgi:predicted phage terminase large subunit-like protein
MHLEETIDSIKAMRDKWPQAKGTILIEDKANGSEIIRRLKEVMPGVIAVNPGSNSKEGRLEACLAYFYGRNVYIPRNAPWREDLVAEWTQFPNWPKDDQVDAAVQVLLYWRLSNAAQRARSGCTL